jgi:lysyl-tRNA synthetase class 1
MTDFLPPEILRFLMIRTSPKQHVNFEPTEVHIIKVFNEFDRFHHRYFHDPKISADDKRVYELSRSVVEPDHWVADFQLVTALIQMPHLDAAKELEKRKGSPFTELERNHLALRIRAAKYWLENYATDDEKTRLQETLPARAQELTATQRAFLHTLATLLLQSKWESDALQIAVFNATRLTPIDQPSAFKSIYRVLLDRDNGPKAGNLLSFLDRDFMVRRFLELPVNKFKFWEKTGIKDEAFEQWLAKEKQNVAEMSARLDFVSIGRELPPNPLGQHHEHGLGIIEFFPKMADSKTYCKRVLFERFKSLDVPVEKEFEHFAVYAREWIDELEQRSNLKIPLKPNP